EDYPDAEIYFITPLPNILQDYLMRERDYLLPQNRLVNVMLELSEEYGFTVFDLYNSNILDPHDVDIVTGYMPDGVHPNEEGYQILAEHIAAELVRYANL
ncbi:MAG: SGNH/GDSL hydrolase family protein, partial [Lachnospiraceae bacterium]|nr:SGNH/GDSL hydrolase family protein [Lachnospiraceae bacterium]